MSELTPEQRAAQYVLDLSDKLEAARKDRDHLQQQLADLSRRHEGLREAAYFRCSDCLSGAVWIDTPSGTQLPQSCKRCKGSGFVPAADQPNRGGE